MRPRASKVIVDGRRVLVRRKRDNLLLIAVMMALFIGVVILGAIIEQDAGWLSPALLFGGYMVWALWMAARVTEKMPSERDVRRGQVATREGRFVIPLLVVQVATMYASGATSGAISGILFVVNAAIAILLFCLLWRFWRRWILKRDGATRG